MRLRFDPTLVCAVYEIAGQLKIFPRFFVLFDPFIFARAR